MGAIQQALLWYWAVPKVYATWNPSDKSANIALSNWNLTVSEPASNYWTVRATIWKSTGKWYWELNNISITWWLRIYLWVWNASMSITAWRYVGDDANWWWYRSDGQKTNVWNAVAYWWAYNGGQVVWVALDMTAWTITMYLNNVSQWVMYSGLTGTIYPVFSMYWASAITNFGATTMTYTAPSWYNQWFYN